MEKDIKTLYKKMCDVADRLEYKGYRTTLSFSKDCKMFSGVIKDIEQLVYFECNNEDEIEKEFILAVDRYIKMLEMLEILNK